MTTILMIGGIVGGGIACFAGGFKIACIVIGCLMDGKHNPD